MKKIKVKKKDKDPFSQANFAGPSGKGWTYQHSTGKKVIIKPSPNYPDEVWYAQLIRQSHNIPDNVDVWKDVLRGSDRDDVWHGRKVTTVGRMAVGSFITRVLDDRVIEGKILNLKDDCAIVEVYEGGVDEGNEPLRKKWPLDRKVVHGTRVALSTAEFEALELRQLRDKYGYMPTVQVQTEAQQGREKKEKPVKSPKEKDKYGFKLGSRAAAINAVLTFQYQTHKQIERASRATSIQGHLKKLVELKIAKVKTINGVKQWRLRKDHPTVKGE